MTRQFNTEFHCSNCGCMTTAETSFGRWIRGNKHLKSENGFAVYDIDFLVHKFKTHRGRDKQMLMIVEVKTRNSNMTDAQRDSMYILNQIIETRRDNQSTKKNRKSTNHPHKTTNVSNEYYSAVSKRFVQILSFGVFKLVFSGLGPEDSESIRWNDKEIDLQTLEKLLAFDIDPVNFKPIEEYIRSHHKIKPQPLFAD